MDSPSTTCSNSTEPTRRSFLDLLLAVTVLSTLASALYPVLRYLKPLPAAGPGGPIRLTRAEVEALETK